MIYNNINFRDLHYKSATSCIFTNILFLYLTWMDIVQLIDDPNPKPNEK